MPQKTFLKQDIYEYRTVGEAINFTFSLLRAHGAQIMGMVLKVAGILALSYFFVGYLAQNDLMSSLESGMANDVWSNMFSGVRVLSILISILYTMIAQMAVYSWIKVAYQQDTAPSTNQVWRNILKNIPALLATGLLLILVYVILAFVIISMGSMAAFLIFLLLVPFVYLIIRLSLFLPALILQDKGVESIVRSWNVVKDNWWSTFGFLLLMGLISYLIMIVVSIPFIAGSIIYGLLDAGGEPDATELFTSKAYFLATNLSSVLSVFVSALLTGIGSSVWYGGLVDKLESVSIRKQIAEAMEESETSEEEGEY